MSTRLTNLGAIMAWRFPVTAAGTVEQLGAKRRNTTIAFNNNSSTNSRDTITDSGNAFLTSGIRTGDRITVSGASNSANNSTFTVFSIAAGTITITTSGTLTTEAAGATVRIIVYKVVPDGIAVIIKARNANTGNVFISDDSTSATADNGFILRPNESVELQINNTNAIYIDAANSGDEVEVLFEKSLQGS